MAEPADVVPVDLSSLEHEQQRQRNLYCHHCGLVLTQLYLDHSVHTLCSRLHHLCKTCLDLYEQWRDGDAAVPTFAGVGKIDDRDCPFCYTQYGAENAATMLALTLQDLPVLAAVQQLREATALTMRAQTGLSVLDSNSQPASPVRKRARPSTASSQEDS